MLDLLNLLKSFNELAIVVSNQVTYDSNLKKTDLLEEVLCFIILISKFNYQEGEGGLELPKL